MTTLHRIALPLINAFFITTVLLYCMYALVHMDEPELSVGLDFILPPFVHVKEKSDLKFIITEPEPIPQAEVQPKAITTIDIARLDPVIPPLTLGPIRDQAGKGLPTPIDSQLVVALGFPPVYPNNALQRGIEGYAVVGFSVDATGMVFDVRILESEPGTTFDSSALKAIQKFKYKARMINGKPVTTTGQRYMFTYELDE